MSCGTKSGHAVTCGSEWPLGVPLCWAPQPGTRGEHGMCHHEYPQAASFHLAAASNCNLFCF